jgi:hypothetical protein
MSGTKLRVEGGSMAEDFDGFAQRHFQNQEMQHQNRERLAKETKPEWSVLKGLVSRRSEYYFTFLAGRGGGPTPST